MYYCDKCDLLKVFWPQAEACVKCEDAIKNCIACSAYEVCDECVSGFHLTADNSLCLTMPDLREYYDDYLVEACIGTKASDFIVSMDEDDEFDGDYFYGCKDCKKGFWLENSTCFDCKTIDPNCGECSKDVDDC